MDLFKVLLCYNRFNPHVLVAAAHRRREAEPRGDLLLRRLLSAPILFSDLARLGWIEWSTFRLHSTVCTGGDYSARVIGTADFLFLS